MCDLFFYHLWHENLISATHIIIRNSILYRCFLHSPLCMPKDAVETK